MLHTHLCIQRMDHTIPSLCRCGGRPLHGGCLLRCLRRSGHAGVAGVHCVLCRGAIISVQHRRQAASWSGCFIHTCSLIFFFSFTSSFCRRPCLRVRPTQLTTPSSERWNLHSFAVAAYLRCMKCSSQLLRSSLPFGQLAVLGHALPCCDAAELHGAWVLFPGVCLLFEPPLYNAAGLAGGGAPGRSAQQPPKHRHLG